ACGRADITPKHDARHRLAFMALIKTTTNLDIGWQLIVAPTRVPAVNEGVRQAAQRRSSRLAATQVLPRALFSQLSGEKRRYASVFYRFDLGCHAVKRLLPPRLPAVLRIRRDGGGHLKSQSRCRRSGI